MRSDIASALDASQTVILNPPPVVLARKPFKKDAALEETLRLLAQTASKVLLLQRFIVAQGAPWREAVKSWFDWAGNLAPAARLLAWLAPEAGGRNLEIGDMLVWETGHGQGRKVIWQSLPNQAQAARFCGTASSYQDVWPAPERAEEASVFYGSCQFSRFALPALSQHGEGAAFAPLLAQEMAFAGSPWLPLGAMLAAMGTAATINSPWLSIMRIQEVRVAGFPALPEGVTRECALRASARVELPLAERMIRVCDTRLEVAAITASGRKNGNWLLVISCGFLLGRDAGPDELRSSAETQMRALVDVEPATFYKIMGFGPQWQFLRTIRIGASGCEAALAPFCQYVPAKPVERIYRLADCALQAALAAVSGPDQAVARLEKWHFSGIGYIDFDLAGAERSCYRDLRLRLSSAWQSDRLIRYHGIIETAAGAPIMTIHNLEFVHAPIASQEVQQEKA